MIFGKQRLSFEEAREIDIVDYLSKLGHRPSKIRNSDYWYLSPLREEKIASFKVNKKLNRWYDHGLGKGGNFIDFAILYHNCTVGELLQQVSDVSFLHRSLVRQSSEPVKENDDGKIKIIEERPLTSFSLIHYLQNRRIPFDLAEQFCKEVHYQLNGKKYFGLGFKNDSGGYEIRNPYFKVSSSPKDITTFNIFSKEVAVFEGFFDFLSFKAIHQNQEQITSNFVILNSVSFFGKARVFMEKHKAIKLYLDRDATGQNYSQYALSISTKYKDESHLYQHYKDLNDWLMNIGKGHKKRFRLKL